MGHQGTMWWLMVMNPPRKRYNQRFCSALAQVPKRKPSLPDIVCYKHTSMCLSRRSGCKMWLLSDQRSENTGEVTPVRAWSRIVAAKGEPHGIGRLTVDCLAGFTPNKLVFYSVWQWSSFTLSAKWSQSHLFPFCDAVVWMWFVPQRVLYWWLGFLGGTFKRRYLC